MKKQNAPGLPTPPPRTPPPRPPTPPAPPPPTTTAPPPPVAPPPATTVDTNQMTIALRQLIAQYNSSGKKVSFSTWLQTTLATYVKNNPGTSATPPADPQINPLKWILGAIEIALGESPVVVVAKIAWESAWGWLFEVGATLPGDIEKVLKKSQEMNENNPSDDDGDDDDGDDDGGDGGGGGGCFAAGTLVATPDGLRAIETIGMADRVVARGEATATVAVEQVTRIWRHAERPTMVLHLANGEQITTTAPHRFFVADRGFVAASDLRPGDRVATRTNHAIAIARIDSATPAVTVYNLSVANAHTYFVGESQVWVHNVKDNGGDEGGDDGDDGDDENVKVKRAAKPVAKPKPKPPAKHKAKPAAKKQRKPVAKHKAKPAVAKKKKKPKRK